MKLRRHSSASIDLPDAFAFRVTATSPEWTALGIALLHRGTAFRAERRVRFGARFHAGGGHFLTYAARLDEGILQLGQLPTEKTCGPLDEDDEGIGRGDVVAFFKPRVEFFFCLSK